MTMICPCRKSAATQLSYAECCQPYVEGKAKAPTAEALMRARYTAFAVGNIDYLFETVAPEQRHDMDRGSLEAWSKAQTPQRSQTQSSRLARCTE